MARTLPTGITKVFEHGVWTKYRVFVWLNVKTPQHPTGRIASKIFPKDAGLDAMKAWREAQRVDARRAPAPLATSGDDFPADCARYLIAVAALPSFTDRARQIREWVAVFGHCARTYIQPSHIRATRDRWLTVGPKRVQVKDAKTGKRVWVDQAIPLSASTVNGRLRALENLYTVLDGRRAYNPVREVPEADPPDDTPRAIPRDVVAAILAALPDHGSAKKGQTQGRSQTKARLTVMAFTGLSHSQLARVTPDDLDLEARTLYLRPRHKGKRTRAGKGQTVPLLPAAVEAFKHFAALECWGKFSRHSMRKSFLRACAALDLPETLRVYDIRHGFGSQLYAASGDIEATAIMMGHRDIRTTRRYTMAAVDPRLQAALDALPPK